MGVGDVVERGKSSFARLRRRRRWIDVLVRSYAHFLAVSASQVSGAITYFAFLSLFPLIAIAFSVVGFIVTAVPSAPDLVNKAINEVLPGLVGGANGINAESIASARTGVGIIGSLTLLYSSLGIASSMRTALDQVFVVPKKVRASFVAGKVSDLLVMLVSGLILVVSVAASTAVTTGAVKGWLARLIGGADSGWLTPVLAIVGILIGLAATTLMLYLIYRVLPSHHIRRRDLTIGAFVAAIGIEVIKVLATLIISNITGNTLYGTFGVIVALLIWLNYFARLMLLGAAVAVTSSGLTEAELIRSEAFATRAAILADQPTGYRVADRLRSGALLSTVLLRRTRSGR